MEAARVRLSQGQRTPRLTDTVNGLFGVADW